LVWGASAGASSYAYCYDTSNDNACSTWVGTGSNTSVNLSGLSEGTTYYWHARATNAGGTTYANASATAFWSFTTLTTPPAAFNKLNPANGATGLPFSITLSWEPSLGVISYEYCIDTSNDNDCLTWINVGNATSVNIFGLSPSTTYYWHVRAINAAGTTYADGSIIAHWFFSTMNGFVIFMPIIVR
jgi:predicted phage tail protein